MKCHEYHHDYSHQASGRVKTWSSLLFWMNELPETKTPSKIQTGIHPGSQDRATTLALSTLLRRCLDSRLADVLKRRLHQLSRHRRAFDITICSQLLGHSIGILWVYDAIRVILRPQVPLQPHHYHRQGIHAGKGLFHLIDPLMAIIINCI